MLDEYVAVDLEMTGLHPKTDRILEVGAVKIKNHVCVAQYQSFVNPHRKLTDRMAFGMRWWRMHRKTV